MATNGYQKYKEKLFINKLYRKLGCLVALVATLRGQTGQSLMRDEEEERAPGALTDNVQLPAGSIPAPRNLYERDDVND